MVPVIGQDAQVIQVTVILSQHPVLLCLSQSVSSKLFPKKHLLSHLHIELKVQYKVLHYFKLGVVFQMFIPKMGKVEKFPISKLYNAGILGILNAKFYCMLKKGMFQNSSL